MWTIRNPDCFRFVHPPGSCQGVPERTYRPGNVVYGCFLLNLIIGCLLSSLWRLRTIDFTPRFHPSQTLDPHGEIDEFCIGNSCFTEVDPFWMSSQHSWGSEIIRMIPRKCQKPPGIMGVNRIHIIQKSIKWFFFIQKKTRFVHILY